LKAGLTALVAWVALLAPAVQSQNSLQMPPVAGAIEQFHRAFAGANIVRLKHLLADDAAIVSAGGHSLSPDEILNDVQKLRQERPDMMMSLSSDSIEIGPLAWNIASEVGSWRENWTQEGSEVELRGRYQAIWRFDSDAWRLVALLLVPTSCSGPYCTPKS